MQPNKVYTSKVVDVLENGDAIIDLPPELLEEMGWKEGDKLNIDLVDGKVIIKRIDMSMSLDVAVFQKASDQNASVENAELYKKLIEEEYTEFLDAIEAKDEVETLDACMDMIWVILGYCHMKGYKVDPAWAEVARSNHAKIDPRTGKVLKREDGKVLKPEGWKPPDLTLYV